MDPWKFQVRIISLQNFITCQRVYKRGTPVIFGFGASPVKSLRNCKKLQNRLSVPDLGSKNGLQFLDFHEISVGVKKKIFAFGKFGKFFFFLYGTVTFNGISRFLIFDEVWRKIMFSVKSWETLQLYHAQDHGSSFTLRYLDLNFVKNWSC